MDIVDTFNHLIPSDQLDDSLLVGQNLECEASNEFGTDLHQLEDSLKNMLSDKDPMFGSASSQFNLLDHDDTNFQIPGSTGLDVGTTEGGLSGPGGGVTCTETPPVKRPVGRPRKNASSLNSEQNAGQGSTNSTKTTGRLVGPRRRLLNRQQKSFLIEKGIPGPQIKKELALGGRINIQDLDVGLWLNPVVVLRRLTVTVGGFRIELLPGPSYAGSADAGQSICFEDGFSYDGGLEFAMVQDDAVGVQNHPTENLGDPAGIKKGSTDDLPLGLGPYVNPNDVQAANDTLMSSPSSAETKADDKSESAGCTPVCAGKDGVEKPPHMNNNKVTAGSKTGVKEQKVLAKRQLKSKQGLVSAKNKNLVSSKPSTPNTMKGPKAPLHVPSKPLSRGDAHDKLKEKKGPVSLKRPGENAAADHPAKVQRLQDGGASKPKPKSPGTSTSPVKKAPDKPPKPNQPHPGPKPDGTSHPVQGTPLPPSKKPPDDVGLEKFKLKKLEKLLQRQKSRNSRSISVEEPQLFIPDNAPVVKKDTAEEQAAEEETAEEQVAEEQNASDTTWDGSNNCGLCKKNHNNMFMVGCGRCDDWFHGDCVGLDLTKVREMEEEDQMYVCLKCCAEESSKAEPKAKPEEQPMPEVPQDTKVAPKPSQGPTQPLTSGGVRPMRKDSERRASTDVKDAPQRTGVQPKQETKSKISSPPSKKPVSVEEIRRSVKDSLKELLLQRLTESDLKVPPEKASEVAKKTERELFHLYKDTDSKYKSKYRSLMFNLKDTKNNVLFKRVLRGEIFPAHLVRMSPEELASKELAAWRQRENRHTIEMIEKEQREVERRPITKITHKGEIEIESQEPPKAPEISEEVFEPVPKVAEDLLDLLPQDKNSETKVDKDTTSQHKSHLFDLHCKICTGHMAPPVEEASTKVAKVATTVVRRQSSTAEESKSTPPSVKDEDLHLSVLEESLLKAKVLGSYDGRSDFSSGRDAFLSGLMPLWRGFINMPAVAKLVTKAFPVSGILDNLTEDLPDRIQVGGRITPQIVWDYFDKIRATGTKEVCLIRFSPETEEDEISYTLLYAYFSSRKRFGVVANNRKQVKDMYLIPLGSAEKVPHQLVPFDGPGLESNRSNLLLGLIIRQRPKRDFMPMDLNETARFIPDSKPLAVPTNITQVKAEDENFYLNKLSTAHTKDKENLPNTTEDAGETVTESLEDASASEEANGQESKKPLRFLPGVLVGWGGELPPLPDFSGKLAADDPSKTQQATRADAAMSGNATKSTPVPFRLDRFVIKKKDSKTVKVEPTLAKVEPMLAKVEPTPAKVEPTLAKVEPTPAKVEPTPAKVEPPPAKVEPPPAKVEPTPAKVEPPPAKVEPTPAKVEPPLAKVEPTPAKVEPPLAKVEPTPAKVEPTPAKVEPTPARVEPTPARVEPTPAKVELALSSNPPQISTVGNLLGKDSAVLVNPGVVANPASSVSLKDKPTDVSTEAFLASLSSTPLTGSEDNVTISADKGDAPSSFEIEKGNSEENSSKLLKSEAKSDLTSYKPPLSGILKKSSAYASEEKKPEEASAIPQPMNPQPVPVVSSMRKDPTPASHHGFSQLPQTEYRPGEEIQAALSSSYGERAHPTQIPFIQGGPQAVPYAPMHPQAPGFPYQAPIAPIISTAYGNTAPFPPQQPPQVPGNYGYPCIPPLAVFPPPHPQGQNHSMAWRLDGPTQPPLAGLPLQYRGGFSESSSNVPPVSSTKDYNKGPDELYNDPWDRPRPSGDRDHYGQRRHHSKEPHHGKKSRHHSRERGKKHEGHEDKYRSRHHGHSKEDRHGERRKERHHSDDHGSRHKDKDKDKDKDRHRRDSDYEKGRRSSKDSYS